MAQALETVAPEPAAVSPIALAHIVYQTARYAEMVAWYKRVLGATAAFEDDHIAFLTYDEEHHRIAFIAMPGLDARSKTRAGVHHVAFTYASLADLLDTHQRLRDDGIVPAWSVNHGMSTSLYYADPDGNYAELQVDNFDTVEEAAAYMYTDAFRTNPIGVDVDPDDLRRRLAAGEDERSLKRRPDSGPRDAASTPVL